MKKLMFVMLIGLLPLSSYALVEARLGYGVNTFDDDDYGVSEMQKMRGLNLDVIIQPPLITDLGLGLRYEVMGYDIKPGGDADLDRLSFLVNYRIIDTLMYVGPIATVGIKTDLDVNYGGADISYDDKLNYTLGVEGGVHLGLISIGGEFGKMFAKFDHPAGGSEVDLGSFYLKAIVGFGF